MLDFSTFSYSLKNYDRRRLKHKLEFIFNKVLQPFSTRRSNIIFFATVFAFVSLFSSVPSPCYINNRLVYCDYRIAISKSFSSCYNSHSWVLCAELCFVSTTTLQGNTHWLSKSHLLKVWDILSHVINTALLHTCSMYWLSFKTDHDRLLAILAKYILSREIFFDIWLTINLRGKKICCAYLDCQPTWMKRIILPASNFK